MPSAQVLAMLQKEAEDFIPEVLKEAEKERSKVAENQGEPKTETNKENIEEVKDDKIEISEKSHEIQEKGESKEEAGTFKVPEFAVPNVKAETVPKCTSESTTPKESFLKFFFFVLHSIL